MFLGKNPTIAVIDSGIGGVAVLKQLIKKCSFVNFIYFADNLYMPYGNKNKVWLKNRLLKLINFLKIEYNVKFIILACNTASTSFDIDIPDVIKMKFCKDLTYFATNLTKSNLKEFNVIADKTLAKKIENNIFNKEKLDKIIKQHIKCHNLSALNSFVLACTHYELVCDIFKKYCPNSNVLNNSDFMLPYITNINSKEELNVKILMSRQNYNLENKIRKMISLD